jgi:hypothetical protein
MGRESQELGAGSRELGVMEAKEGRNLKLGS